MRKLIAMVLAMSMVFTMGVNAFASGSDDAEKNITHTETFYVELDNGKLPITLTEYEMKPRASEDGPDLGTTKMKKFTIDSDDMRRLFAQVGITGQLLSATEKRVVAEEIAGRMSKVDWLILVSAFIEYVYDDLSGIVWGEDWEFSVVMVWSKTYYNLGGYYVEGWKYGYTEYSVG